jgi:hypothetical protein
MTACVDDCGSEDRRGAMCVQPKVAAAADRAAVIRRSSATLPIFSIDTMPVAASVASFGSVSGCGGRWRG